MLAMKYKAFFFSLCFSFASVVPHNTIILWDLNEVLIQPKDRFITLLRFPYLKKMVQQSNWSFLKEIVTYIGYSLLYPTSSENFIMLAEKHNNPFFKELVIQLSNSQAPTHGISAILKELHHNGYEQHIGSNLGRTLFDRLINPSEHPQLAEIFDYITLNRSYVVNNDTIAYPKPSAQFFKNYLKKNNLDPKKTRIIFIDDRLPNVTAAQKLGFEGVHFKNAFQLRNDLARKGITIKPCLYTYSNQRHTYAKNHLSTRFNYFKPL